MELWQYMHPAAGKYRGTWQTPLARLRLWIRRRKADDLANART